MGPVKAGEQLPPPAHEPWLGGLFPELAELVLRLLLTRWCDLVQVRQVCWRARAAVDSLDSLDVGGDMAPRGAWPASVLANAVGRMASRLTHLCLHGAHLADSGAGMLCSRLTHHALRHLDVSSNSLTRTCAFWLGHALGSMPSLRYLDLSDNKDLGEQGIAKLLDGFRVRVRSDDLVRCGSRRRPPPLRVLALRGCGLGMGRTPEDFPLGPGCGTRALALELGPGGLAEHLATLDLKENWKLGDLGLTHLFDSAAEGELMRHLRTLDVSQTGTMARWWPFRPGPSGMAALVDAINACVPGTCGLAELRATDAHLGDGGLRELADSGLGRMTALDLSQSRIGELAPITQAARGGQLRGLRALSLDRNFRLSTAGLTALLSVRRELPALERLCLDRCQIDNLAPLGDAVACGGFPRLEHLSARANVLDDDSLAAFLGEQLDDDAHEQPANALPAFFRRALVFDLGCKGFSGRGKATFALHTARLWRNPDVLFWVQRI
jgi:hypothetical protein